MRAKLGGRLRFTVCGGAALAPEVARLFIGLGILLFQSISLVGSLKSDLQRAEQSVAQLRERVERMEPEAADERIFGSAVGSIRDEMRQAVTGPEPLAALSAVAERIERASVAAEKRKPEG